MMKHLFTLLLLSLTLSSFAQFPVNQSTCCDTLEFPLELRVEDYSNDTRWIDVFLLDDIHKAYSYSAVVTDIYDGDTFTLEFDLGFGLHFEDVIRLARVDTPELRGKERPEGVKVRDKVAELILNKPVVAVTDQDDRGKYGRLIAEIYYQENGFWINLSQYLLENNLAEPYD